MQLNILIVGVLFPAIPLMMINFGNRYDLLAKLIRNLRYTVISEKISTGDSARFFRQINSLRKKTAANRCHSDLQLTCIYL